MRRLQNIQNILKINKNIESELILFWPKKNKIEKQKRKHNKMERGGGKKKQKKKKRMN